MIVQYLIDWESIFPADKDKDKDYANSILGKMALLTACIGRNGALVKSNYALSMLSNVEQRMEDEWPELAGLIKEFRGLYMQFGISVDVDSSNALTLNDTIRKWCKYLTGCGLLSLKRNDARFVLVSNNSIKPLFFSVVSIHDVCGDESLSYKWTNLLRYETGKIKSGMCVGNCSFKDYLEAFLAVPSRNIRIYDPYISKIFDPIDSNLKDENAKAWRISLAFILDILSRNRYVEYVDIITKRTKDQRNRITSLNSPQLRLKEVVDDILCRIVSKMTVSFHFIGDDDDMHDRFMSNDWYAFAVGHGFDVCKADNKYIQASTSTYKLELHNIPKIEDMSFSTFNVFYACNKNNAPEGIGLFGSRKVDNIGNSAMYPANCHSRPYCEVSDWFDYGNVHSCKLIVNDRITICINEREPEDAF